MTEANDNSDDARAVRMHRRFGVPVARLYAAWTEADQACRWMGPRNVDCRIDTWDFREGGAFRIVMISDEGNEFPAEGRFRTIDPPHRLAMTWAWQHEDPMRGIETLLNLEFIADGDAASVLHLTHSQMPDGLAVERHEGGWHSALDCLEEYLSQ
jgi:uncharacterized protein YndB with AHSA1/START domain